MKHAKYSSPDDISGMKYYYPTDNCILILWVLLSYFIGMIFLDLIISKLARTDLYCRLTVLKALRFILIARSKQLGELKDRYPCSRSPFTEFIKSTDSWTSSGCHCGSAWLLFKTSACHRVLLTCLLFSQRERQLSYVNCF